MASCLTSVVPFDIFYFIAFQLLFLPICQAWADSFVSRRQFPVKVKGKTLIDFSSVTAPVLNRSKICQKPVFRVNSANGSVPEAWFWRCFLSSAATGGRLWICGCSPYLKLWFPCSLNFPHSAAWAWAQIFSCLPKSAGCQTNASLWRFLGAQPEQATSWPEEVIKPDIILLSVFWLNCFRSIKV